MMPVHLIPMHCAWMQMRAISRALGPTVSINPCSVNSPAATTPVRLILIRLQDAQGLVVTPVDVILKWMRAPHRLFYGWIGTRLGKKSIPFLISKK